MARVYVFPGQGSQHRGMGGHLFPKFPAELRAADRILGYSVAELCRSNASSRQLDETRFTQPALYVVSTLAFLSHGGPAPDFLIGHSLGEFAALFAAGVYDFETGLRLVKRRAEAMQECNGGGMAAVIGPDSATIRRLLAGHELSELDIANYNGAGQHVLAGPDKVLQKAKLVFKALGSSYVRLNVSGPFHSRYMSSARPAFARAVAEVTFAEPRSPVISNVTARPHERATLAERLVSQLDSPVRWEESVRFLLEMGATDFLELSPGAALSRLIAAIAGRSANVQQLQAPASA